MAPHDVEMVEHLGYWEARYLGSYTMARYKKQMEVSVQACIDKNKAKNVFVIGHTDTSGTEEYNIALSERRAQTVADYLARLGTDPARMQVVPKGETEPTGLGDDKDRRVEFQWH